MEKDGKLILVPWDFSPMAEYALVHGIKIARNVDNEIEILHIVKSGTKAQDKEKAAVRLEEVASKTEKEYGIRPRTLIREGSIFSEISDYATDKGANLVIMGTHGIKGIQKITGSYALRVIVGSKVPYLVIQDKPRDMEKYHNVVFPIDFRVENKEKLYMAIYMGKYFESKVHILKEAVTDRSLLKKINVNLNFAMKFLLQNNIDYELHEAKKDLTFAKETVRFAEEINADLIMVMTTKNITIGDYLFGATEQQIIANPHKIPVLCVNPKANFAKVAQYMYG
jgi:nucleotide-binding universal stress UspA family protein